MQTIKRDFGKDLGQDFADFACGKFAKNPLGEYEIKGSKFLAFGVKISLAKSADSAKIDFTKIDFIQAKATKSDFMHTDSTQSNALQNLTQNPTQNLAQNLTQNLAQNPLQNALNSLRQAHPKAVHFVYAFRAINSLGQIIERSSDDGEPKGSSALPSLNVLRGWEMVDFGIIIVRYFGGTKLGIGGLVRAYSKATLEALNTLKSSHAIISYAPEISLDLRIKYSELSTLKYAIKSHNLTIQKEDFLSECVGINLIGSKEQIATFSAWIDKNKHLFL